MKVRVTCSSLHQVMILYARSFSLLCTAYHSGFCFVVLQLRNIVMWGLTVKMEELVIHLPSLAPVLMVIRATHVPIVSLC